ALHTPEGRVSAAGTSTPLYDLGDGAWHVHPVPNRGSLVLASGGAALAVRSHVYTWTGADWKRATTLKSPVTALWAGPNGELVAATQSGDIARQGRSGWTTTPLALDSGDVVTRLVGRDAARLHAVSR